MKLRIAIAAHGRFHAFALARELIRQGHDVTLFTNYPRYIAERFGVPRANVVNFVTHGIMSRAIHSLHTHFHFPLCESLLHRTFSRWLARCISKRRFDVVHCFSGVAEELFASIDSVSVLNTLVRGSAHIRTQATLLEEEEKRVGAPVERPSDWIINREEREYNKAKLIFVLSSFALNSFIEHGVPASKLRVLPLGTQLEMFRSNEALVTQRLDRIISNQPLRILMVGSLSFRKGALDLVKIASDCGLSFVVRFVGDITDECKELRQCSEDYIEFVPRLPEFELPAHYAWGDIFLFPTIEDGYAVVLPQAQAAGLPILTTPNCSGPDIIREGETGWILPIRSPEMFVERLHWCDGHRSELADMCSTIYHQFKPRDWSDVATDFVNKVVGSNK